MFAKIISSCILLFSLICSSQEFNVIGNVNDTNSHPIAYANAVLIDTKDSSIIKGTTTNEFGAFNIDNVKAGAYIFKVSFLGFKAHTSEIKVDSDTKLGIIILKENLEALDGVTIVAKRPTVKRMVDRLVFNVENSTLSNNNVLDVLKHTPGVLVHDGTITIKQSTPTVYINDRRVHLSINEIQQLLEGTSATNIKSVEVITSPPAKYEAEGGAVLNIITSKNIIAGYNGSVFGNFKQGSEFPKYSFGTSHFFKTKKLNTYLNYSISPRKDYQNNDEFINFIENNQIISSWETEYERIRKSENQNINANIDYEINKSNSLGFSTNMIISPRRVTKTGINSFTEIYSATSILDSTFNTINKAVEETFNLAFTLDYIHKFKKEGEKVSSNLHYTNYDFSNFQDVKTGYFLPSASSPFRNNQFQTFSSQTIELYTGQVDYQLPINESAHFEAGAKLSKINSESVLNQYIFEKALRQEDLDASDTFLYDETNYATYVSFSKDWESWRIKSGLRVEFTDIKGNSLSTNQINETDYIKFFPSFHVLNKLNENSEIYFNYNRRIYRPRYADLNPYKYFLNDNTYKSGDPNLKPQIDDSFTLGYVYNEDYTFEIYYRYENDPSIQIVFQDNENNFIKYLNTNIDRSISYGLDLSSYTQIQNRWSLYAESSIFYYENQFYALESSNELFSTDKWSVLFRFSNNITFLKDKSLLADISYLYISPYAQGPLIVGKRSSLDISLSKTLWNNKASVSMGVIDVFNTKNFSTSTKYLNQDIYKKRRYENRFFTLGFNYKFGNFRLNSNKKEIDLEEIERLN
ncbi:outer membrane beta-barrel family protein [Algibacter agarivorans]|uniref:Outer membrane beta-barrel family protein n=1 Tax=Algibacter agarivorans TaxID=1109741 RepID=A0ABP9GCF6_9FLAO